MYKKSRLLIFVILSAWLITCNSQAATQIFVNNVATTLASAITSTSQTSMIITSATGFPTLAGGDWAIATLVDSSGNKEIVKITAIAGTTCTITRGEESTTARTFAAGSIVSLRLTAAPLNRYEGVNEFLTGDGTDLELKGDIIPDTDEAYDIGSSTKEVNEIFTKDMTVSGTLTAGTLSPGQIDTTAGSSVIAYMSGDQNISSGVSTTIEFDTESHDALGEFNTTTYTFTPTYTGRYAVSLYVQLTSVTDQSLYSVALLTDGTITNDVFFRASGTTTQTVTMPTMVELTAGEALKVNTVCSTGAYTVLSGSKYTVLSIHRIWD